MRVVFMGTPEFAVVPLRYLLLNHHDVVAVYTQPDKPAGRGRRLVSSPVKVAAASNHLPVVQPDSLKEAGAVSQLADFSPEVIVVAAYGKILPPAVLDIPRYGCINIHPSLLPKFRGASPVAAAILAGEEFTGVSVMLMDQGLDTGPVLVRAQVAVAGSDTTGTLTCKLSNIGAQLLQEVLVYWPRGEITARPQNEAEATFSRTIVKEEGLIDWQLPAVDIWRRVRAFQPWPECYTTYRGRRLKIVEAVPLPGNGPLEVGRVVTVSGAGEKGAAFGISTGDGVLGVLAVQPDGKRPMSAAEFLRGQRQLIGELMV